MEREELLISTTKVKQEKQSFINDTFMWVQLARQSVENLPSSAFLLRVPKTTKPEKTKQVYRNSPNLLKQRILNKDIFNSAFVSLIASVEDYFYKVSQLILLFDNFKYEKMANYNDLNYNKSQSYSLPKNEIIDKKLFKLFSSGASKQLEVFKNILDINLDEYKDKWIEAKARRDVIVHNGGKVDKFYLHKINSNNQELLDSDLLISEQYFNECISFLKRLIGITDRQIRLTYKESSK